ncbi:S-adenosyl-L-methionine-dependent methyltransferase [Hymenopellis radicata]|nr:S-adenosyl-L-methionine-dependent methyltransferase [Hymenopellis radicata]
MLRLAIRLSRTIAPTNCVKIGGTGAYLKSSSNESYSSYLSFLPGTNELYDRARPSYQANALAAIKEAVAAKSSLNVVEIGAGTGIFTRAFLKHPDWSDAIKELRATVDDKRVTVSDGSFTESGIPDGWADLITVAQVRIPLVPDYDAASAEFARILKPGGTVAFIWNLEDRDAARWVAQLRHAYEQHEGGSPQFRLGLWRQTFDTASYQKFFKPPVEKTWSYVLEGTVGLTADRVNSKSYIQVLPDNVRSKVLAEVKETVARGDDLKWIDEGKGIFEYPYQTFLVISDKK